MELDTYYAPARRADRRKFENQISDISHSLIMDTLLRTMAGLMVVLNEDRQIVGLNNAFLKAIGVSDSHQVLGLRLGDSLSCIHAQEEPSGCGTTQHCSTCGAVIAMMAAIRDNRTEERICTLTSEKDGVKQDICLLIRAQPITIEVNRWILIFAQDVTQQQFWTNIERVFFHDMSNMLTTLLGNSQLLLADMPENDKVQQVNDICERLCSEINVQRSLSQYKDTQHLMRKTTSSLGDIRRELGLIVHGCSASEDRQIIEIWPDQHIQIYTDVLLVSRILGNMIINALEATQPGGHIKVTTTVEVGQISWEVWNDTMIPPDIQKRIFQRHFSTKSHVGRGLGTFSMKLFGEEHLKGKVTFNSTQERGTTFTFQLPC